MSSASQESITNELHKHRYSEIAVLTRFGVAARAAQLFETSLVTFATIVKIADNPEITPSELYNDPFKILEKKTMGQVLRHAKQYVEFHPSLDDLLQKAVESRNGLFHHFFPANQERLDNENGRRELIDELDAATTQFIEMAQAVDALTDPIVNVLKVEFEKLESFVNSWRNISG